MIEAMPLSHVQVAYDTMVSAAARFHMVAKMG
jgi:hypothetical protein